MRITLGSRRQPMPISQEYKPPISLERVRGHWIGLVIALVVAVWRALWAIAARRHEPIVAILLALLYGFIAYWFWRAIDYTGWRVMSRYLPRR